MHPAAELPTARRGYSGTDFESDPQEYINKAVKKYAGHTFFLPSQEDGDAEEPDADDPKTQKGPNTFFIPKNINEEAKARQQ